MIIIKNHSLKISVLHSSVSMYFKVCFKVCFVYEKVDQFVC